LHHPLLEKARLVAALFEGGEFGVHVGEDDLLGEGWEFKGYLAELSSVKRRQRSRRNERTDFLSQEQSVNKSDVRSALIKHQGGHIVVDATWLAKNLLPFKEDRRANLCKHNAARRK